EPTRPERRWSAAFRRRHEADREILALAVPALGALAADPLVSLVDTAYVGRLGVVPLAALGVNVSIFGLAFLVFNFLAYGTTPMVARAVGSGDRVRAGRPHHHRVERDLPWLAGHAHAVPGRARRERGQPRPRPD